MQKKTLKRLTFTAPDGSTTINADLFDGISQGEINGYLKSAPKPIVESVKELERYEDSRFTPSRPLIMKKLTDYTGYCPDCNELLTAKDDLNYCSRCGQKIIGRRLMISFTVRHNGETLHITDNANGATMAYPARMGVDCVEAADTLRAILLKAVDAVDGDSEGDGNERKN